MSDWFTKVSWGFGQFLIRNVTETKAGHSGA
jgi:hypothetical protein